MNAGHDEVDVAGRNLPHRRCYVLVETKVRRDRDTEKTDVLAGSGSVNDLRNRLNARVSADVGHFEHIM